MGWPSDARELERVQERLALACPEPWQVEAEQPVRVGGCFICFGRGGAGAGASGDPGWAAACILEGRRALCRQTVRGIAGGPYEPGLLALREGEALEAAVRALPTLPDVLIVNATGRDHPRRAGLALHLGAVLGVASVGVTHRPLLAEGWWPPEEAGARSPLTLDGELVGHWVRTRVRTRPLAAHAAWRTSPETATWLVAGTAWRARTPEPLRVARHDARVARDREQQRS